MKKNNKAFTLIELIVVMAIISVLVLLSVPKFDKFNKRAEITQIKNNIKQLENASERYYIDNQTWPIVDNVFYTKIELDEYTSEIFDKRGNSINLDENGKYYSLDFENIHKYIQKPKNNGIYIIQNPVGDVYYLANLTEKGKEIFDNKTNPEDISPTISVINPESVTIGTNINWSYTISPSNLQITDVEWTTNKQDVYEEVGNHKVGLRVQYNGKLSDWVYTNIQIIENKDKYILAIDNDFQKITNIDAPKGYYYKYIGTDEYVEVPKVIKSEIISDTYRMFEDSSIQGVKLINSNITNMSSMFLNSTSVNLDLSNLNTANVTDMSAMFQGSKSTSLDLSNFDTSNVINMRSMFRVSSATSLDLSNFNTNNVTDMSDMFYISKATNLNLTNFNTANVTNMSTMFFASNVTNLDLSNFNTSKVTDMNRMFYSFKSTTLDVSKLDTFNVTDMSKMFSNSKIINLDLNNFKTNNVTNMSAMFENSSIISLDLKSFDTSNVTDMSNMFYKSKATTIDVSKFNTENVTNMSMMFRESVTTNLDLTSFNVSKVTVMNQMFSSSAIDVLDLSSFDTSKINSMYFANMFADSKATIGYAKTAEDAIRLNTYTNKPSTLTFYVK